LIETSIQRLEEDDLTGLSGWMYSDLLLGLVVIFLATITFVPNLNLLNGENGAAGNTVYSYTKTIDKPLSLLIQDDQIPNLPALVESFKAEQGIGASAEIVYVQVVGSYNDRMELPSKAVERALELSGRLDLAYPELFANSATTFSTTMTIPSNQVAVRIIFAEKVIIAK
jgi:hypothetical protein